MNKSEYQVYLQSEYWRNFAKYIKDKRGSKCQLCGAEQSVDVHHSPPAYAFLWAEYQHEDLVILLCRRCHSHCHFKEGPAAKPWEQPGDLDPLKRNLIYEMGFHKTKFGWLEIDAVEEATIKKDPAGDYLEFYYDDKMQCGLRVLYEFYNDMNELVADLTGRDLRIWLLGPHDKYVSILPHTVQEAGI